MRIAIDARELLGRPTGVGRYLRELLARWTRMPEAGGHELVLVAPAVADVSQWRGPGGATARTVSAQGRHGTWWEQVVLPRALRGLAPDVVFCPAYSAPVLAGAPVVVAIHDVSFAARPDWYMRREGARRRLLARLAARRARAVLTLTAFSRDEIVRRLGIRPDKVHVVPPAVDSHPCFGAGEPSPEAPAKREPLVLYVGSVFNRRRVPELIAGFASVALRRPDVRLEIVGENRTFPPQDLDAIAARHAIGDRVRLRSYVDDAVLSDLYARASVFVFLSEYEGFGLTPLEALRAGVPVVLLDTPVAREVYGEAATFVAPADPAGLAAAIGRLLDDDVTRVERLRASRPVVARYSWDRTARQTLAILESAAAPRRAAGSARLR